jgi:hypothetical protein
LFLYVPNHGLFGRYAPHSSIISTRSVAPKSHWTRLHYCWPDRTIDDLLSSATIETYTASFGREGPKRGIVIARNGAGERIVANTLADEATAQQLMTQDPIGHFGHVRVEGGINILEL